MTQTVGIGVIGLGWMGQVHSRAYLAAADRFHERGIRARLVICADEIAARTAEAQALFGFAETTHAWQEVLAHPEVEAVSITAPNALHLPMALAAAAAGKHIYCEKPVGRGPQETVRIAQAARQAGVRTLVGFNYRWAPMVQHALQLIRDRRLGSLTHYRGRFFSMYGSNPLGLLTWRFDAEQAGLGVLGDLMSHVIDMAQMLVGPITRVVGHRHTFIPQRPLPIPGQGTHFSLGQPGDPTGPVSNEDYVSVLVQFENGVQGTLEACRAIFGPKCEMAFELNGTQGALSWNFERMNELDLYLPDPQGLQDGYTRLLGGPRYPEHGRFNPGDGIGIGYEDLKTIETQQFLESVVNRRQATPGLDEAVALAAVQAAILRSWQSGGWEEVTDLAMPNCNP